MSAVKRFVIDRAKWARSRPMSTLLQDDGKRCCVGIYLAACGMEDDQLLGYGAAHQDEVRPVLPAEAAWLVGWSTGSGSGLAFQLYGANDYAPPDKVEEEVRLGFYQVGIEVVFTGEDAPSSPEDTPSTD